MENVQNLITEANRKFMNAVNRSDAAGITALYAQDAKLLPPGFSMITGTDAIQGFWQGVIDMGIKEAKLETTEVQSQDGMAYEIGRYTLSGQQQDGNTINMTGKYVVVWKHQEGTWKLYTDIWNADSLS